MQVEHKLALIQRLRREQYANDRRSHGFGGCTVREEDEPGSASSFRGRFLLALLLFLCFFYLDREGISLGSINSGYILELLEENLSLP